jgi:hypothetical protein
VPTTGMAKDLFLKGFERIGKPASRSVTLVARVFAVLVLGAGKGTTARADAGISPVFGDLGDQFG